MYIYIYIHIRIYTGRCPSGDNPLTDSNEEDCLGLNQAAPQNRFVGKIGNRCHINCSNQGVCDYNTGLCKCFDGFWGENCNLMKNAGASQRYIKSSNSRTGES